MLLNLMSRSYLEKFPEVDDQEKSHIMMTAIDAAANFNDPQFKETFQKIFENDKNMNVRKAAYQALQGSKV